VQAVSGFSWTVRQGVAGFRRTAVRVVSAFRVRATRFGERLKFAALGVRL